MDNSTQSSLCQSMRACGLPRKQTHQLLNLVIKYHDNNGVEWMVSRIKEYRQWYETYLAGDPKPPAWCRKSKDNTPIGVMGWLFKQPPGKVLGILSCGTAFKEREPSKKQLEKFNHGLQGNHFDQPVDPLLLKYKLLKGGSSRRILFSKPDVYDTTKPSFSNIEHSALLIDCVRNVDLMKCSVPSPLAITGNSIPVGNENQKVVHPTSANQKMDALVDSWCNLPQPTIEFLADMNCLDHIPINVAGTEFGLELDRPRPRSVGRIGCIQQGELKARWIANPNRVVQHYLQPLKDIYMDTLRDLPTDCTHNQEEGIRWTQEMLRKGTRISGSDLTSASDLLDLNTCAKAITNFYGFDKLEGYDSHLQHFLEISRMDWYNPFINGYSTWKQGQPLGTAPSFGMMGLTNNMCGMLACKLSHIPVDSFRVIGDDIIIDDRALNQYTEIVTQCFGGEINHTKTLTSSNVAEFAGRIVTKDRVYLKSINYNDPSDQSFMSIMSQLGPQASFLLKPRQRRVFNELRFVPGVVVEGPYLKDSYGEPLVSRIEWYDQSSIAKAKEEPEPDLKSTSYEHLLLNWQADGHSIDQAERDQPWPLDSSYLDEQIPDAGRPSGDPRKVDGMSTLDVFEKHIKKESWESYTTFKAKKEESRDEYHGREITSDLIIEKPPLKSKFEDLHFELSFSDELEEDDEFDY